MTEAKAVDPMTALVTHLVGEILSRVDWSAIKAPQIAYSTAQTAEQLGMTVDAIQRDRRADLIVGSLIRGKWHFTPERIREYVDAHEVVN